MASMRVLRFIPALIYSALIVWLSAQSNLQAPKLGGFLLSDKLLHFIEYFVFTLLWSGALLNGRSAFPVRTVVAGMALFAASDELHQFFVPGRQADIFDLLADLIGIAAGLYTAMSFCRRRKKLRESGLEMKHTFVSRLFLNSLVLCISDSIVLLAGLYLGNWIIYLIHGVPISVQYSLAVVPVWCAGAVVGRVVPAWGIGPVEEFRRVQLLLLVVFGIAAITVFMSHGQIIPSRIVYGVSLVFSALLVLPARVLTKKILLAFGYWGCSAVLYGPVRQVEGVIDDFIKNPFLGYIPCGVMTDELKRGERVRDVSVIGGLSESTDGAAVAVAPVALAEEFSTAGQFDRVFSGYRKTVLLPDIQEDIFLWAQPRTLGSLIGLEIAGNLLNPFARLLKRAMDLTLILLTAPLWIPVFLVISLVLFTADRGNPFFMRHRIGRKNRAFCPLKFRTMVGNAEEVLEKALLEDDALRAEWAQNCKLRNDPRVTRIGRFLRRTSLDELPQVLNVLAGQMSLVGPRPLPDYHHEQLAETVRTPRARVRPGITGLWQVSGRSDSGTAGMEKWDTFYVRNWSIWLDIIILARTVSTVIRGTGAY